MAKDIKKLVELLLNYEAILQTSRSSGAKYRSCTDELRQSLVDQFGELPPIAYQQLRMLLELHAVFRSKWDALFKRADEDVWPGREELEAVEDEFREDAIITIHRLLADLQKASDRETTRDLKVSLPDGVLPDDITKALRATYAEVLTDYDSSCHTSAIILCGKVIETCLAAVYTKKFGKDPDTEGVATKVMIERLKKDGFAFQPVIEDQLTLIAKHRNKSVHGNVVIPTKDQAIGIIFLTKDILLKSFSDKK